MRSEDREAIRGGSGAHGVCERSRDLYLKAANEALWHMGELSGGKES